MIKRKLLKNTCLFLVSAALIESVTAPGVLKIQADDQLQAIDFQDMNPTQVVNTIGPIFTEDQKQTGILASVSMAQFILESGYGKSELAANSNNCFGIKAGNPAYNWDHSTWDGESIYTVVTEEEDEDGEICTIESDFRKYPHVDDSILDHSWYLLEATKSGSRRYPGIENEKDYRKACQIIKDGGYASDSSYVDKLCNIIEHWDLTQFDVKTSFVDVKEGLWYTDFVARATEKGLMTGLDPEHFGPNEQMSRAMAATVLHRMDGKPEAADEKEFEDVNTGLWYSKPIAWARGNGIITGYTGKQEGLFGPDDPVTREQMACMITRYFNYRGIETDLVADLSVFNDFNDISGYALEAIQYCVAAGILSGAENGTMIYPLTPATRAECAKMLLIAMDLAEQLEEED